MGGVMGIDAGATPGTVTVLLRRMRSGEAGAGDELFLLLDADLRRLATSMISGAARRPGGDLNATAVVNAACERLLNAEQFDAEDRKHFFFVFGRAMHDVLVELARAESAAKRGGNHRRVPLVEFRADGRTTAADMLDLHEALAELGRHDAEGEQVVRLRFYCGRTLDQAAQIMGCTYGAARGHWDYARAWLHERLERAGRSQENPGNSQPPGAPLSAE